MSDEVKIGEIDGSFYLLKGSVYLDQLLMGDEPVNCPISFITCESWSAVMAAWEENDDSMPWAIHPNIIARIKEEVEDRELVDSAAAVEQQRSDQRAALADLEDDDDGWLDNLKV